MVLKFRKRRTLSGGVIEAVCDDVWMQKLTAVCDCRSDKLISSDRGGKSHHLIYNQWVFRVWLIIDWFSQITILLGILTTTNKKKLL